VIAGLRGEDSVAELCRKEGINQNLYYRWSKDFLEAGKKRWQVIPHAKRPATK
jgi:transposase